MSLLLDLWSALKGIRATAKAVRGLMSSITFTFPLNPPLAKGDLWQGFALHCFAIVIVASKSCKKRLEISIWCPTIEDKSLDLPSFFYGSGGRTYVLSHIYNPSKPPFDKGGLWQDFVLHCSAI